MGKRFLSGLKALAHCCWQEPIGLVIPLLAAAIVTFAPQMPDMWVALQNEGGNAVAPLMFGVAAVFLGVTSWYWTRAALFARVDQDDRSTVDRRRAAGTQTPAPTEGDGPSASWRWAARWTPRLSIVLAGVIALQPAIWADRGLGGRIAAMTFLGIGVGIVGILAVFAATARWERTGRHVIARAPRCLWKARSTSIIAAAPFGWPFATVGLLSSAAFSIILGIWPQWIRQLLPAPVAALFALAFLVGILVVLLGGIRDVLRLPIAIVWRIERVATRQPKSRTPRWFSEPIRDGLAPVLLLAWLYANPLGPNEMAYQIRLIGHEDAAPVCSGGKKAAGTIVDCRPDLAAALEAWSAARFPDWKKDHSVPVVIVAAEGGASRAAAWLLAAMHHIDARTGQEFGRHLFAVSGVSGGSLGAVTYLQAAVRYGGADGVLDWRESPQAVRTAVRLAGEDLLSESVATYFINDVLGRLVGTRWPFDERATVLEHAFERFWEAPGGLDLPVEQATAGLVDLHGRRKGVAHLLLNGTDRETGQRLITSTIRFDDGDDLFAGSEDLLTVIDHDVPAATAVTNSARFPYVSPAGHFRRLRPSRIDGDNAVLDGGYFENYGARTASELARAIARNPLYVPIVVVVSNDAVARRDTDPAEEGEDAPSIRQSAIHCRQAEPLTPGQASLSNRAAGRNVFEFMAPISGLAAIRGAHGRDALYILQRELCDATYGVRMPTGTVKNRDGSDRFFHVALSRPTNRSESAPMNWVLNDRARHFLIDTAWSTEPGDFNNEQIAGLSKTIKAIKRASLPNRAE